MGLEELLEVLQHGLPVLHVGVQAHGLVLVDRHEQVVVLLDAAQVEHADRQQQLVRGGRVRVAQPPDRLQPVLSVDQRVAVVHPRQVEGRRERVAAELLVVLVLVGKQVLQVVRVESALDFAHVRRLEEEVLRRLQDVQQLRRRHEHHRVGRRDLHARVAGERRVQRVGGGGGAGEWTCEWACVSAVEQCASTRGRFA